MPPGLHVVLFQGKGWGGCGGLRKNKKKAAIQEVALHHAPPPLAVGGAGVSCFHCFNMGPSKTYKCSCMSMSGNTIAF